MLYNKYKVSIYLKSGAVITNWYYKFEVVRGSSNEITKLKWTSINISGRILDINLSNIDAVVLVRGSKGIFGNKK